jgi:hypothetical protein
MLQLGELVPGFPMDERLVPSQVLDVQRAILQGPNGTSLSSAEIDALRGAILLQWNRLVNASARAATRGGTTEAALAAAERAVEATLGSRWSQPYADVARKHLSDLILDKYVVVRYTAIGEQGYLVARILLEQADINAQMLRDGVAWYFQPDASELVEADQQLYQDCEKAARSEKRGLWRDPSPTAPWEFKNAPVVPAGVSAPTVRPPQAPLPVTPAGHPELTSDDLMSGLVRGAKATAQPNVRQLSPNAPLGSWVSYQPADQHFSILVPSDGIEFTKPIVDESGVETTLHYVLSTRGQVLCQLTWAEGPTTKYTDAVVVTETMQRIFKDVNRELAKRGVSAQVTSKELGSLRLGSYVGKEFSLRVGESLGVVRILSKQTGAKRELLVLMVLNKTADEISSNQFLSSLRVN